MNCIQKQQLVSFPKVRIWKPWFRHFNNHKEFRNEGTVHLFSLMALFSYANFRSNERMISGERYMEAPGQWICKLGSLPRILRVHSKRQALEQLDYYEKYGFLTYEWLDEENEIIRFSITNWKEHCTSLQYNYYSYKGSGFFFFPLPVGRMLLRIAHKTEGIVFSELDVIMDMWLHTILNDPKVRGSEYMPVVYYSNMRGVPLLSYKRSSYTVTATKNYTGLDRNDSSYIDKTVEKNGRTLSLSNVTWSVESTALVGDELVPATYSAVATYSGSASSTVATGYITTAEYKGTVVSSGISSILYTVTYLGTKIEPTKAEPTFKGAVLVISIIGGTALLAALLFLGLTLRKNTTVYKATGKGNEYEKCGRLHLKAKNPELRIDRLKDIPEGVIAIEVDQAVAKKLFGQTIAIRCYDNTVEHTVGEVNGSYWFKVDIGSQEGESNYEEEP